MKGRAVARDGWIEQAEAGMWLHARRWPVRMDLAVTAMVPARAGFRLARAIRQDMWRALADLRGFSPVVRVAAMDGGAAVTAGGQIDAAWPRAATAARVAALLADPAHLARWRGWAGVMLLALIPGWGLAQVQGAPAVGEAIAEVAVPAPVAEAVAGAPSGLALHLQEVLIEPQPEGAPWARFRLVAPDLDGVAFARVEPDFPWICESFALPYLASRGQEVAQVIVSIAAVPIPFGETAPEVTQYFEVFRPVSESGGDRCIWEVF